MSIATIGSNALLQGISLIIFARWFGPVEFATIAIATAGATVAAEVVGLGSGDTLVREVSRSPQSHRLAFGRALWVIGMTIVPLSVAVGFGASRFLPAASLPVVLAIVTSEIVIIRSVALAEQIAIAHHQVHVANASRMFAVFIRFAAVGLAVFVAGVSNASDWAPYAAGSASIIALGCLASSSRRFGNPQFQFDRASKHVGISFSLLQIFRAAQFSLDKFVVASVAAPATVGAFGVASRVAQLGMTPASAITRMTYPTFFKKGAHGLNAAVRFALRITKPVIGVALLSSAGLVLAAYVLPVVLGAQYDEAKTYLILLAPLPIASALQNLAGSVLSGADHQAHRIYASGAGLLLTVIGSLTGAQLAGAVGATLGFLVGHFASAAAMLFTVAIYRDRRPSRARSA